MSPGTASTGVLSPIQLGMPSAIWHQREFQPADGFRITQRLAVRHGGSYNRRQPDVRCGGNYVSRGESTYSFSTPYFFSHSRYEGTYSDATVSGSITIGSTNILDGLSDNYATLSQANSGSVRLYRSPYE